MQYNTTRCIDENQDNETLKDMTKSGKQRPWRKKEDRWFCCKLENHII
jgi:plasmid rolling circle replication initiator protein Rep